MPEASKLRVPRQRLTPAAQRVNHRRNSLKINNKKTQKNTDEFVKAPWEESYSPGA